MFDRKKKENIKTYFISFFTYFLFLHFLDFLQFNIILFLDYYNHSAMIDRDQYLLYNIFVVF